MMKREKERSKESDDERGRIGENTVIIIHGQDITVNNCHFHILRVGKCDALGNKEIIRENLTPEYAQFHQSPSDKVTENKKHLRTAYA